MAQAAKDMSPEEVDLLAKAEEDKTIAKNEEVEFLPKLKLSEQQIMLEKKEHTM